MMKNYSYYEIKKLSSVWNMIRHKAACKGDKTAFSWFEKGCWQNVSYRDFQKDVFKISIWISKQGFQGNHIGIYGKNSYKWLVAFAAIVSSGSIAVPLDIDMPVDEINDVISRMDVDVVFADETDSLSDAAFCKVNTFDVAFDEAERTDYPEENIGIVKKKILILPVFF